MKTCIVLLAVLLAVPAMAGDTEAGRFHTVAASFPAPSEKLAFSFHGVLRAGALDLGTFSFSAIADTSGKPATWKVVDVGHVKLYGLYARTEASLRPDLAVLSGTASRSVGKSAKSVTFRRSGKKMEVSFGKHGKGRKKLLDLTCDPTATMSATLLFCRLVPAKEGVYELMGFDPTPEGDKYFRSFTVHVEGRGVWQGKAALLFTRKGAGRTLRIALDPDSRDLLGMRMEQAGGLFADYVPDRFAGPSDDPFALPAKTAVRAAMVTALAYGTGDSHLLDSIADWPSISKSAKVGEAGSKVTPTMFRARILEGLERLGATVDRAPLAQALALAESHLTVTKEGADRAVVKFPKRFRNLAITVGKFGDAWRLVALPGR